MLRGVRHKRAKLQQMSRSSQEMFEEIHRKMQLSESKAEARERARVEVDRIIEKFHEERRANAEERRSRRSRGHAMRRMRSGRGRSRH